MLHDYILIWLFNLLIILAVETTIASALLATSTYVLPIKRIFNFFIFPNYKLFNLNLQNL